ncbi:MAG: Bax inhibitor-1/YccA family protein [Synergistaceae bacterium]|jgi:FtsH-binding integral membrane protein|nr:Bax inhibitor-1/YccA family protein [Synergistaceae bacterium]
MQDYEYKKVSAAGDIALQGLMTKVYMWMGLGLLTTAAVSYYAASSGQVIYFLIGRSITPFLILAVAELGIVFFLSSRIAKMSQATASALFFVYSALNGLTIAPLLLVYTGSSVASAFFSTAGMFGAMSVYGTVTKRDLSGWGSFLMMGLIGLVIASVANIFFASERTSLVIAIMGVFIFTGLTAYDTFKIRAMASGVPGDDESAGKFAVLGALTLYLDFINMFIFLLRIFGKRR